MKNYSKNDHAVHPQARLLPWTLFYRELQCRLSDDGIELMSQSWAEVKTRLAKLKSHEETAKLQYWYCITLSHPDLSHEDFIHLAQELHISCFHQLQSAAYLGRLSIYDQLVSQEMPLRELCLIFEIAAEGGQIEIINRLIALAGGNWLAMMEANGYEAFYWAAGNGHLLVVNRLLEVMLERAPNKALAMMKAKGYEAFYRAANNGHLPVVNRLLEVMLERAPNEVLAMMKANGYDAFRGAARSGHLPVVNRLLEVMLERAPDEVLAMMKANGYEAFHSATGNGHLPVVNRLLAVMLECAPDEVSSMMKAKGYEAFYWAANNGHLPVVNRLLEVMLERAPDEVLTMIKERTYYAFRGAVHNGHLPVVNRLLEVMLERAPDEALAMMKANGYEAFHSATGNGHLPVVNRLLAVMLECAPDEVSSMMKAKGYEAFYWAANNGHLPVVNRLLEVMLERAPNEVLAMMKAKGYEAFYWAANNGHLPVVNRLLEVMLERAPEEVLTMIKANGYDAFRSAAGNGHLPVVNHLLEVMLERAPDEVLTMIKERTYYAFRGAVHNGHLPVVNRLLEVMLERAPDEALAMMKANGYDAFRSAAGNGHLPVVNHLLEVMLERAPDEVSAMMKANGYEAFYWAADKGHFPVVNRLLEVMLERAPDEVPAMIKVNGYRVFRKAACYGHLPVVNHLLEVMLERAPDEVLAMMKANGYEAFYWAANNGHLPVVNRLLSFSSILAYAEAHTYEYRHLFEPYITKTLSSLRQSRQAQEASNPHTVFDIMNREEAKHCFYLLRNLIRRNDTALQDDIRFLLDIPSVKALAHQDVTEGRPNELLNLALVQNNSFAAELLLRIPAVRTLAAANNYYREGAGAGTPRGLDLSALARDRESSMSMLTRHEQQQLAAATAHYEPFIQTAGINNLFNELLEKLKERYEAHRAIITKDDGTVLELPTKWADFNVLPLSATERTRALKAYYQNNDHTALRYLSQPNHWMHPSAGYVYTNDARTERWSTFEEYKSLIVLFWLAAQDATMPPTDGHTLEGRIDLFVKELALIGRAHNWNKEPRLKANGEREEYDDLEGDRPSCFSGVKRRLFQSVIGHPLLRILTLDDVKQELCALIWEHFKLQITSANREDLLNVWNRLIDLNIEEDSQEAQALAIFNITPVQKTQFLEGIVTKYGPQFNQTPAFKAFIEQVLSDKPNALHVITCGPLVDLSDVFKALAPVSLATAAANQGIFAAPKNTVGVVNTQEPIATTNTPGV